MSAPTTTSGPRIPTIPWVRIAYPHLWEPARVTSQGQETGVLRYSCNLHLDNAPPLFIPLIQQAIFDAYMRKWPDERMRPPLRAQIGGDHTLWNNKIPGSMRIPLVWGPAEWPDDPNAKGWVLIATSPEASKPVLHQAILSADGNTINGSVDLVDRAAVYPGAEAFANISIYAYNKGGNSYGVSAGLNGVAFTGRDLGRFDSRPSAGQMFGGGTAPAMQAPQAPVPTYETPLYQQPAPLYGHVAGPGALPPTAATWPTPAPAPLAPAPQGGLFD